MSSRADRKQRAEAAEGVYSPAGQIIGPGQYFRFDEPADSAPRTKAHKLVHREISPDYDWREAFLDNLEETGFVVESARAAGISHTQVYRERRTNPEFAERWNAALESATEHVEAEVVRRAMNGSDLLLMFYLKARKPEVYREQYDVRRVNINVDMSGDDMNKALTGLGDWQKKLASGEITGQPVEIIVGGEIIPDGEYVEVKNDGNQAR